MLKLAGRWDQTQRPREDFMWTFKTLLVNDRGIGTHTINKVHKSLCLQSVLKTRILLRWLIRI